MSQQLPTPTGEIHPAATLFPLIDADEFESLVEDIKANGLKEPGWLMPDGALLDGRHRLAACERAGVPMRWRVYEGDDPIAHVLSYNLRHRHLNTGQRAMVALAVEKMYAEQAAERKTVAGEQFGRGQRVLADLPKPIAAPIHARDLAAKATGASSRAIGQAKRVSEKAPDLAAKVTSGEVALDAAEKQLRRREATEKESAAREITVAELPSDAEGDGWRLLLGDFRDRLADLPDGSVDLIITDPPYPAEFMPLWSDLSRHAARVLKPQGVLLAMTGQIMLLDVMNRLQENLSYGWVYVQPLPGSSSRIMGRHVLQSWKPWVAFTNGKWPSGRIDWHPDMLDPSYRAKDRYRWEQDPDPAKLLIDTFSSEGSLIVDPFTGTGAYGVAALSMGRRFVGCEMDAQRFDKAKERVNGRS